VAEQLLGFQVGLCYMGFVISLIIPFIYLPAYPIAQGQFTKKIRAKQENIRRKNRNLYHIDNNDKPVSTVTPTIMQ
jgi:hypothetical protein